MNCLPAPVLDCEGAPRTHQIRVHLQDRRTPIVGDADYGNSDWNKQLLRSDAVRRPLLHAYEIEFAYPATSMKTAATVVSSANAATGVTDVGYSISCSEQGSPPSLLLRAPLPSDMQALVSKISAHPTSLYQFWRRGRLQQQPPAGVGRLTGTSKTDIAESSVNSEDPSRLLDVETGLLMCSTEVPDSISCIEAETGIGAGAGGGLITGSEPLGFIPSDRLSLDNDDDEWLSFDLPETEELASITSPLGG